MYDFLSRLFFAMLAVLVIGSMAAVPAWFIWHHFLFMALLSSVGFVPLILLIASI